MAEYSSLKVPELKKLLTERSLPVTGNKADLIARLQANDAEKAATTEKPVAAEDEIDYSDDEPTAPAPVEKAAPEAAPAEPAAAPATATEAPAATETADAASAATETSIVAAEPLDLAEEARKRAERLKRFGIEDPEAKARAERAARFGITEDSLILKGLNEALPERQRKRGRGEDGRNAQQRQNKRQSTDRRGGHDGRRGNGNHGNHNGRNNGGRQQGGRQQGGRQQGQQQPQPKKNILDDPAEKAKAEARAKRFAA